MNDENRKVASEYNAQGRYFLEAASLASEHAKKNRESNPTVFHNFEGIIVGTHHSFAAEIFLKGIIYYYLGSHPRNHEIKNLLNNEACEKIKKSIKDNFRQSAHISYTKEELESALDEYINNLNKDDNHDRKEIENITRIREELEFGSFDYFLELHSNHFVKMRYACEKLPPPLDMNFTSFLNGQLRYELEKLLQ